MSGIWQGICLGQMSSFQHFIHPSGPFDCFKKRKNIGLQPQHCNSSYLTVNAQSCPNGHTWIFWLHVVDIWFWTPSSLLNFCLLCFISWVFQGDIVPYVLISSDSTLSGEVGKMCGVCSSNAVRRLLADVFQPGPHQFFIGHLLEDDQTCVVAWLWSWFLLFKAWLC